MSNISGKRKREIRATSFPPLRITKAITLLVIVLICGREVGAHLSNSSTTTHGGTDIGTGKVELPEAGLRGYLMSELGGGAIEGVPLLTTRLGGYLLLDNLRLGLELPLRHRIWEDGTPTFTLRQQDWDERSDYLRILRFLHYSSTDHAVQMRIGVINAATIGHGTLMSSYYNVLNVDSHRTGMQMGVDYMQGGMETVVDDVVAPTTGALRVFLHPVGMFKPASPMNRFTVGFTVAGDRFTDQAASSRGLEGGVLMMGADLEATIHQSPRLRITPYGDLNRIWGLGRGIHLGANIEASSPQHYLQSALRLEYRHLSPQYLPGYLGTFYQVERLGIGEAGPKSRRLREDSPGGHGVYAEVATSIANRLTLATIWEEAEGQANRNMTLRGEWSDPGGLRVGAAFAQLGMGGLGEAFQLTDSSLLLAEARYQWTPAVYLLLQAAHRWTWDEGEPRDTMRTALEWNGGVGVRLWF